MEVADRIYFAVPGHYTIGEEFETWAEAERFARERIRQIDGTCSMTREFVDVRVESQEGDRPVHRVEVFA